MSFILGIYFPVYYFFKKGEEVTFKGTWPDNFVCLFFCWLNFKIRLVNVKNYRFVSCFEVVGANDTNVVYCFIGCGYHTLLIIWHIFNYFLCKYPILECHISGCEWENYEPSIGTKISKKVEVSRGDQKKAEWSKKWSGQAPVHLIKQWWFV